MLSQSLAEILFPTFRHLHQGNDENGVKHRIILGRGVNRERRDYNDYKEEKEGPWWAKDGEKTMQTQSLPGSGDECPIYGG